MSSSLRIIVTGLIAQHPTLGGVTWDYLQYVLGLARLGHDVYYFEDSGQWPYNLDGGPSGKDWIAYDPTPNVAYLANVMAHYGLEERWAYRFPIKPRWFGLSHKKRREILESAELLINVSGTLKRPSDYRRVRRLAYVDSDPVFTQVKLELTRGQIKFRKRVNAHDVHFSFGERLSEVVSTTGHHWLATRTPIVLSEWRPAMPSREVFTTVMSWTSYKPLKYGRHIYAQKDMELPRFIGLPRKAHPTVLEVALSKTPHRNWQTDDQSLPPAVREVVRHQAYWSPSDLLASMGWRVVDPLQVCPDLESYRAYIEASKAEWSVAKHGYVQGQSGWFSCRSACYLAADRPVIVQDTGFDAVLPVGEGIVPFRTLEEAIVAIREVEAHYTQHAKAARAIAEAYFDSDKVLTRLIEEAMRCDVQALS
jgi:hypothetical protein